MHDRQFELEMDKWAEVMQEELNQEEDGQNQIQLHINDVLEEASRWGMRNEVEQSAKEYWLYGNDIISCYNEAFKDHIK